MRHHFRKVVERAGWAAVIEIRYRATPVEPPCYLDEVPREHGGLRECAWHVAYLRQPDGTENDPIEMMAAEASLRLEHGFEEFVRAEALTDFAERTALPGRSRR
jgi:hypothetical protein